MQKQIFAAALFLFTVFFSYGQEGVAFVDDSWSAILEKAQKEDKLIFLDAYTTWCGPCRMMKMKVFPREEVGQFYNQHFINAQIDMEKGEGVELAKKYEVEAFPTLLFISSAGKMVHKSVGYLPAEGLLDLGKTALDPATQLSNMEDRFAKGDRNPQFLHDFAYASYQALNGQHAEAAKAFLATQKDWATPECLNIIFLFTESTDGKMFDFLVENRKAFDPIFGKGPVMQRIQNLILTKAFKEGDLSEEVSLQEVDRLYQRAFPESADEMSAHFKMNYYSQLGATDKFVAAAFEYYSNYPVEDYLELNNIAWRFYELVEDKDKLKEAVKWAEKSVKINSQYFNNDTVAALYFKLGKKKKARKAALRAIEIGKANGEDVSGTEGLLERIRGL